jgi:sigma-B regulation protein RsbU (phosphoserine phosphatase)
VTSQGELAREVAELRSRRRDLLKASGAPEEIVAQLEALDRDVDDTFATFIANQAAALHQAGLRLGLAVEASDLGIWEFDPGTGDRRWSRRCKELFGFPIDDSVVTQERFMATLHPDDRPRWHAVVRDAMDPQGDRVYRIEYRIVRPSDGKERWISATGRAQFDGDRPVGMFGTLMDVTDRKHAEEERELFLGMLGHDLRNPIASIALGADVLLRENQAKISGTAARIGSSARRMHRMIEELLDFARARAGHLELRLHPIDLDELCRETVDDLALANPDREVRVEAETAVRGHWDRDRLRQVIENLIVNALAHGHSDAPVWVRVRAEAGTARLDVLNEGDPIPEATRASLFAPFRRGTDGGRGLGLGLYIANQIVTAHGGTISASSEGGVTTFSIVLPNR